MSTPSDKLAEALLAGRSKKIGLTSVDNGCMYYKDKMIISHPHPNVLRITQPPFGARRAMSERINAVLSKAKVDATIDHFGYVHVAGNSNPVTVRSNEWLAIGIPAATP